MRAVGKVRKVRGFNGARITKGEPMNPNPTPEERADCAHAFIARHDIKKHDGGIESWWQCEDCETKFVSESAQRQSQQRIEELEKALSGLERVPAVRQVLGTNHGEKCRCPMCTARQALNPKSAAPKGTEESP